MIVIRHIKHSFCIANTKSSELIASQKYIKDNVQSKEWVPYLQSNYLPKLIRPPFYTLHWFNHQIAKIPMHTRDSSLALGKLRFWQDTIDSIYAGHKPTGEPISQSLRYECQQHPISKIHFQRIIQARIFQTNFRTLSTVSQLVSQCQKIFSSIIIATLQMMRIPISDQMVEAALEVGRANGICHYIKQLPYTLRMNRLYMPQEIADKHNINLTNIWERVKGEPREELYDVVLEVASFAKQSLQDAKTKQSSLPKDAFRAYLSAIQTQLYLQQLQKANFNVFNQGLNKPSIIKLPYRMHTAAKKGNFTYN